MGIIEREIKYADLINRPYKTENEIWRRPPVYLNYTKEGRLKKPEEKEKEAAGIQEEKREE